MMTPKINLVFQQIQRCFKKTGNSEHISVWKWKRLPEKINKPPTTSNNSLLSKIWWKLLKQNKLAFSRKTYLHRTFLLSDGKWVC